MRSNMKEYEAVEVAAMKFVKSVAKEIVLMPTNCFAMKRCYSAILMNSWSMV